MRVQTLRIGLLLGLLSCPLLLTLAWFRIDLRHSEGAIDVLVISDSNGVGSTAWPQLIAKLTKDRVSIRVQNESRAGRTLLVDRGDSDLSASRGIDDLIRRTRRQTNGEIETIVLCLGTNDLQAQFKPSERSIHDRIPLIEAVIESIHLAEPSARIWILSPPPFCQTGLGPETEQVDRRWQGATALHAAYSNALREAAQNSSAEYIDLADEFPVPACSTLQDDGVHLNAKGHLRLARIVSKLLVDDTRGSRATSIANPGNSSSPPTDNVGNP